MNHMCSFKQKSTGCLIFPAWSAHISYKCWLDKITVKWQCKYIRCILHGSMARNVEPCLYLWGGRLEEEQLGQVVPVGLLKRVLEHLDLGIINIIIRNNTMLQIMLQMWNLKNWPKELQRNWECSRLRYNIQSTKAPRNDMKWESYLYIGHNDIHRAKGHGRTEKVIYRSCFALK